MDTSSGKHGLVDIADIASAIANAPAMGLDYKMLMSMTVKDLYCMTTLPALQHDRSYLTPGTSVYASPRRSDLIEQVTSTGMHCLLSTPPITQVGTDHGTQHRQSPHHHNRF
jgi:hypothetical protein